MVFFLLAVYVFHNHNRIIARFLRFTCLKKKNNSLGIFFTAVAVLTGIIAFNTNSLLRWESKFEFQYAVWGQSGNSIKAETARCQQDRKRQTKFFKSDRDLAIYVLKRSHKTKIHTNTKVQINNNETPGKNHTVCFALCWSPCSTAGRLCTSSTKKEKKMKEYMWHWQRGVIINITHK